MTSPDFTPLTLIFGVLSNAGLVAGSTNAIALGIEGAASIVTEKSFILLSNSPLAVFILTLNL